jgi:hypothetical protein
MNGEWLVGRVSSTFFMIYPTSFRLFMEPSGNECKGSKNLHQSLCKKVIIQFFRGLYSYQKVTNGRIKEIATRDLSAPHVRSLQVRLACCQNFYLG